MAGEKSTPEWMTTMMMTMMITKGWENIIIIALLVQYSLITLSEEATLTYTSSSYSKMK